MGVETVNPALLPIGHRLREIRGAMRQPAMAKILGASLTTYGRYERGSREVGALLLQRYAELGWNPAWIVTGHGQSRLQPSAPEVPSINADIAMLQGISARLQHRLERGE